jgi:D-amino-acid dehydrogenase
MQNSSADVFIIGGGVIGVCTAYYLAEQGARVTLVEQGQIAAGSSYGNAGLIVPSHSIPLANPGALASGLKWMLDPESPFYIKPRLDFALVDWLLRFTLACAPGRMRKAIPVLRDLGRASSALHKELAALDGLDCGYAQTGLLMLYNTERGLEDGLKEAHLLQEFGLAAEVLDGGQVRKLEPSLRPETVGGTFFPGDAHFTPANFMRGLALQVEKKGVCIRTDTQVLGFETAGRKVTKVRTTRGDFQPGQVVLAAGSWSPSVARELGLKIPIQAAKGYSITVKRPAANHGIPLLLGEARVAVTPMVSAAGPVLRFAGTLELVGHDFSVKQRRVNAILRAARGYLGGMENLELVEIWRGLRPCTPDGLPIIGRPPSLDNIIVAAGHATLGMSLGPITGKLVAQLVNGETPALDLGPLRVDRF